MPLPPAPPVIESLIDPLAFTARIEASSLAHGFRVERFGEIASVPLIALTKRTPRPRPRLYLSAGLHGDEPAPPLALLHLIEQGVFDARAKWFVCPLLNPAGFIRRTRENAEGLDLNHDYKSLRSLEIRAHARWLESQPNFDATFHLHEDWEAQRFYLYELCKAPARSLARTMIEAVEKTFPIEAATVIDGRPVNERSIIRPINDPLLHELWPESIYLRAHHTQVGYTIETPSSHPLASRIGAHSTAIAAAVDRVHELARSTTVWSPGNSCCQDPAHSAPKVL